MNWGYYIRDILVCVMAKDVFARSIFTSALSVTDF